MADSAAGLGSTAPNPPKKRSFFKKPSWKSETKTEKSETEADIFSHSNEFKDIVADRERRRKEKEAKEAKDKEKKRRKDEERETKRRRTSEEEDGFVAVKAGLPELQVRSSKERSHTPRHLKSASSASLSPTKSPKDPTSLSARYGSVSTVVSPSKPRNATIVELSEDSDTASDTDSLYAPPPRSAPIPIAPIAIDDDEPEEEEDPELAALAAKARQKRRAEEAAKAAQAGNTSGGSKPHESDGIVNLLINSSIPNTKPLILRVRISSTLELPLKAWCERQPFSKQMRQEVFVTWKGMKLWETTQISRLGIQVDEYGVLSVKDDPKFYTEEDPPKIHIEAWTQELFDKAEKEKEEVKKRERSPEPVAETEEKPAQPKMPRLVLKAKGIKDFGIRVKLETTFEHLANAYRQERKIPADHTFYFSFDGERLKPFDKVGDTEMEDMDAVEVHFT